MTKPKDKPFPKNSYSTMDLVTGKERRITLTPAQYRAHGKLDYETRQGGWAMVYDLIKNENVWIQAYTCGLNCRCWMAVVPNDIMQRLLSRISEEDLPRSEDMRVMLQVANLI